MYASTLTQLITFQILSVMFTIEQIHAAHSKVKSGADFPQYVQDLKALGVSHYDTFVADGSSRFYGADNFVLEAPAKYPTLPVNEVGSADALLHTIAIHQNGETDYPTFCQQAAEAGVEKSTTHMVNMEVSYYDKEGNALTIEPIPTP